MSKELVSKIVSQLYGEGLRVTKSNTIRVYLEGGGKRKIKEFKEEFIPKELLRETTTSEEWIGLLESDGGIDILTDDIITGLVKKYRSGKGRSVGHKFTRDAYFPILLIKSGHRGQVEKRIVNREDNTLSDISYNAWLEGIPKEEREYIDCIDGIITYNPYNIDPSHGLHIAGGEIMEFNSYKPPEWRKKVAPDTMDCPESIEKFLSHLFPDDDVREFVINWLHVALVERNQTYLVLNGAKGTGKGIFSLLASMLVGKTNFNQAPGSLLSDNSDFNKAIKDKRLIVFDEAKISKKEHTKLKKYANRDQNIEAKGVDADITTETFNSFIINNNDDSDMYLEHDDRRFSVVELTDIPMLEVYAQEEIDDLIEQLEEDEQFAYDFGYYIYLHGKSANYTATSTWKKERFTTLVLHSLSDWKRYLLEYIKDCESDKFLISDLRRDYKKDTKGNGLTMPIHVQRLNDFLKNFRYSDGTQIAYTYKISHKVGYIIKGAPNPDYVLPSEDEAEDIEVNEVDLDQI